MLTLSAFILGLASLFGLVLFTLYGRVRQSGRFWLPGVAHGAAGLAGAGAMALALRGPPRGVAAGAGSFGTIAAILVGAALCAGLTILVGRFRNSPPAPLLIGVHATLGVAGLVMLAAYAGAGG